MSRISFEEYAKQNVAKLVDYAVKRLYLDDYDVIYAQNLLLDALSLTEPYEGALKPYDIYETLDKLSDYAVRKKLIEEHEKLNFETKLMGMVMPSPSKTVDMFDDICAQKGVKAATDFLFKLSEDCTYLRRPDLDKNIVWEHESKRGNIVITVNLSKPEKTPEQVRLAKLATGGYPKCMLCAENLGWAGNAAKPARQTIRTIPIELDGESWFVQYSPYQYFDQHLIAVSREHRPMNMNAATFKRMAEFVQTFPHYFIGSNAPLPIVGGSILAHDHYQGGSKVLPVFKRGARRTFSMADRDAKISVVDWYNSVIRVEGSNLEDVLYVVNRFFENWLKYSDESQNIICKTAEGGEITQHNAVTPICSFNDDGEYQFNLILRNNRTDAEHPFGIFHPAQNLHNIKQEAIGIIEVMGLFILPGRLKREMDDIKDIICGKVPLDVNALSDETHPLHKHSGMIMQLALANSGALDEKKAQEAITGYINDACEQILDTTAVFKNTDEGQAAFDRFIKSVIE